MYIVHAIASGASVSVDDCPLTDPSQK